MSLAAAKAYVDKAIRSTPEYAKISTVRQAMSTKMHSLNVSYSTFQVNNTISSRKLSTSELKKLYYIFIVTLKDAVGHGNVYSSLAKAEGVLSQDNLLRTRFKCILIVSGTNTSVIGYDYRSIRDLITVVTKSRQLINSPIGAEQVGVDQETGEIKYKSVLELGHTLTDTPFGEILRLVQANSDNPNLNSDLSTILNKLYDTQASVGYEFLNTSDNSKLGKAVISLVIQPADVNRKIGIEEYKLYQQFLSSIVKNLNLSEIPGSNTLKQDAVQFYKDQFLTGLTGKKRANVKKHSPVKGSVKVGKDSKKNKVANFKNTEVISPTAGKSAPALSLISLQNLMNQQLQDVVAANMGDGNRSDILNYRSGRFASSVNVERLTMSKQGMITAFYNYMKYPYATFSAGGRQQNPKSRDPKLLISKSIREIAQEVVTNQLRAVEV
jgi:hypothetical protein